MFCFVQIKMIFCNNHQVEAEIKQIQFRPEKMYKRRGTQESSKLEVQGSEFLNSGLIAG